MQQFLLSFPESIDMSLENFLVLPTNNFAYMSVQQFPQMAGDVLAIYGEEGVGKTHLVSIYLHRLNPKKLHVKDLKLPLDLTAYHYVVDGIDELKPDAQEVLFHLFNHIKSVGGSLMVTSRKPVAAMEILPDLKSRLLTAPQIQIEQPKDAHLEVFLVKYASDRQIYLEQNVVAYILKNCERNVKTIETIVRLLDQLSLEQKRKITIPLVKEAFEKL